MERKIYQFDDLPKHFATTLVREQEHRVVYAHTAFADRQVT